MEENGNSEQVNSQQIKAEIVGACIIVFVREIGRDEIVKRMVPLSTQHQRSVLHFVQHKCHGGRLQLSVIEDQKRIIVPP